VGLTRPAVTTDPLARRAELEGGWSDLHRRPVVGRPGETADGGAGLGPTIPGLPPLRFTVNVPLPVGGRAAGRVLACSDLMARMPSVMDTEAWSAAVAVPSAVLTI
jgi:hypothetical protein